MKYSLPAYNLYGSQSIELELPENWNVKIHSYRGETAPALTLGNIRKRFKQPASQKTIAQDAAGCRDAVIIFDDITRPTPVEMVATVIIEQLEKACIPRNKIRFIAATGMHRAMNREEFVRKLGEPIVDEFRTYSHNPFFNNNQVGICREGFPIELNAECVNADYKIGVGSIFPHPNTGLSGAGKLVVPGIASMETIRRFHLQASDRWSLDAKGRTITTDAADLLGLNCKVDALLNGSGEIARLFIGDCKSNIEDNYDEIKEFFTVERPEPADLVLANNYFKPTEAGVAVCYPEFFSLVKQNGTLIVAANTPNGAAAHYLFGKWGDSGIGGVSYTGENKLPGHIGRYYAFSEYIDKATSLQYHFDPDDPRFHWAKSWKVILDDIGGQPLSVLILPYATVPYFSPELPNAQGAVLTVGKHSYTPREV